jgi:peptidyl-tRNA hydrolase, PTH1 family
MILIVGLGNIGPQYEYTRHNIGFRILDQLGGAEWQHNDRHRADIQKVSIKDTEILLAKPTTMMNLSGYAVSRLAQYYKIAPEDIWIVYDELDLPLGRMKISTDTSDNGHNGIISIHEQLGHNRFWRFRIGIESREQREIPGRDFVLQDFSPDQQDLVDKSINQAVAALTLAIDQTPPTAMQVYNRTTA